jgi:predicted nuclease with TOPRIM domain
MHPARHSRIAAFGCLVLILVVAAFFAGKTWSRSELMKARDDAVKARRELIEVREELQHEFLEAYEELRRTKERSESLGGEQIRMGEEADKLERAKRWNDLQVGPSDR